MFPRSSTPPTGPRGLSPARRGIGRGGIQKRRAGPLKVDKDGDLMMGQEVGGEVGGRGGNRSDGGRSSRGRAVGRGGQGIGTSRGNLSAQQTQQAIIRGLESHHADILESRISQGTLSAHGGSGRKGGPRDLQTPLVSLRVRGLKESKAASNPDGGLKDLLSFLERKASSLDVVHHNKVRIKKVCLTVQVAECRRLLQLPLGYTLIPELRRARRGRSRKFAAYASCDLQSEPR
jgi:nuclear RNA export factor